MKVCIKSTLIFLIGLLYLSPSSAQIFRGPELSLSGGNGGFFCDTIAPGEYSEVSISLGNVGDQYLTVSSISVEGNAFSIVERSGTSGIPPGSSGSFTIRFNAATPGNYRERINFITNSITQHGQYSAYVFGTVEIPKPRIELVEYEDFGYSPINIPITKILKIKNTGKIPVNILSAEITGSNASEYKITSPLVPGTMALSAVKKMSITFTAPDKEYRYDTLLIKFEGGESKVLLSGYGVIPEAQVEFSGAVDFNYAELNAENSNLIVLKNTGFIPVTLLSAEITGQNANLFKLASPFVPSTLQPGGIKSIRIIFTPVNEDDAYASLMIKIEGGEIGVNMSGRGTWTSTRVEDITSVINPNLAPNPITEHSVIKFTISHEMEVELRVADINGKIVRTLQKRVLLIQGDHSFVWNRRGDAGEECGSGLYRIIIVTDEKIISIPALIQ